MWKKNMVFIANCSLNIKKFIRVEANSALEFACNKAGG
jgi:hypothetical protein